MPKTFVRNLAQAKEVENTGRCDFAEAQDKEVDDDFVKRMFVFGGWMTQYVEDYLRGWKAARTTYEAKRTKKPQSVKQAA